LKEIVKICRVESEDATALHVFGTVDAILDLSSLAAAESTHFSNAVSGLRHGGHCSIGGFMKHPTFSWNVMCEDITTKGTLMYQRDDIIQVIKMLKRGLFPAGTDFVDV
jgi:D-arabinose 1-dehydrogenase-like Zn-dependent alcohol dehydrogenase